MNNVSRWPRQAAGMRMISFVMATLMLQVVFCTDRERSSLHRAHSHNDYLQAKPFVAAYDAGFGSIEADIYPVNGALCVAHSRKEIQSSLTLSRLYLEPLAQRLAKGPKREIKLLIDIKDSTEACLALLVKELQPLARFLSTSEKPGSLTILISGKRPLPGDYDMYPSYIFFDDDLRIRHDEQQWKRVGQVSLQFSRYCAWKDEGGLAILTEDRLKLKTVIDSVHNAGKTIRFWAAPDTPASWKLQLDLGADLVGTDNIEKLSAFLSNRIE